MIKTLESVQAHVRGKSGKRANSMSVLEMWANKTGEEDKRKKRGMRKRNERKMFSRKVTNYQEHRPK